jgi:hypothetical protein
LRVTSPRLFRLQGYADRAVRDEMVAKGWVPEVDGPDGVAICAP